MSRSEKNSLYQKYLSGDISKQEMHQLNQYALDDDFLFDALEGVHGSEKQAELAISDLEKRLDNKPKKRKPLYLWLSAAAGVAIIVFALINLPSPGNQVISDVVSVSSESEKEVVSPSYKSDDFLDANKEISDAEGLSPENESKISSLPRNQAVPTPTGIIPSGDQARDKVATLAEPAPPPIPGGIAMEADLESKLIMADDQALEEVASPENELREEPESQVDLKGKEVVSLQNNKQESSDTPLALTDTNSSRDNEPQSEPVISKRREARGKSKKASSSEVLSSAPKAVRQLSVKIADDQGNSKRLSNYIQGSGIEVVGTFVLTTDIIKGQRTGKVLILESSNEDLNEELLRLVESFEDWRGSGNKLIEIGFN